MTLEEAMARADTDEEFQQLLAALPEAYAKTTDDSLQEVALAFARAAYGRGYVTALEERP